MNTQTIETISRDLPSLSNRGISSRLQSKIRCGLVSVLAFLAAGAVASAQGYSIDWFKIAGGSGTSTAGVYAVSGTIGQTDAGRAMTNGQYSLTGGFWVLPTAVQVDGAQKLTIVPATPGYAMISWSPNAPGYVLQETLSLSPSNWNPSPSGATNPIIVPATVPARFYRLFKP